MIGKNFLVCGLVAVLSLGMTGCDSNPTNEPTAAEVNAAVDKKFEAIDNDPNMTPEQKAEMKKHMGGYAAGNNSRQSEGRK